MMKPSSPLYILWLLVLCAGVMACTTEGERRQMAQVIAEADSMNRNYVPMTSDSLLLQACEFYDRHGSPNERMKAHYLLGCVYRDLGEAPHAIDCYQQAADCADTLASDCDYYTLAAVYGQMSELFRAQFLPDDEIAALKALAKAASLDNDTLTEIIAIHRLSSPYFMKCDSDSVLIVEEQARKLYLQYGYKEYAGQAILGSIRIALNRCDLSEAERLLNIFRNKSGLFNRKDDVERIAPYYIDKGIFMMFVGNLDSASYYYHKAVEYGRHEGGYRGLLSVFEKQKQPDSIAKYARLFAAANDSSFLHVNQEVVHRISALYNYSRQQKIAEKQAEKAREESRKKKILMGVVLLLIAGTFFTIRCLKKRAREKYLKLSAAYDKSKSELDAAIDRLRLLRYDYEEALKGKEEEQQKQLQILEEIQQKESEIQLLKAKTEQQESQLQRYSSVETDKAFKKSNIYKLFYERRGAKHIHNTPSEEDWLELIELFRTHYVRFNTFITYDHRLPINQYRYCVLLRLGFDGNEIGILMSKDKDQRHHLRKFICENLFGESANVKDLEESLKEHY